MLVGKPNKILLKYRNSKIHNVLDIMPISLKLWIFINFNTLFPVVLLVYHCKPRNPHINTLSMLTNTELGLPVS
jgi:hypothetical protein